MVLDITDQSVKSLYVEGEKKPYSVKGVSVKSNFEPSEKEARINHAIRECFVQADSQTSNAIIGLGGPNVFGFMLIVKINRKEPLKPITDKELQSYYGRIREIAYKQAKVMWNLYHPEDSEFAPLDLVVTSFGIEDGKIEDPVGKASPYVQIAVFSSYAQKDFYNSILGVLDTCDVSPLTVTTTLYSQVKLLSEQNKNYILVDVGGEYTDVAVIFGKDIVQTKSFQIAGNYLTKYMADRLGLDFKKAQGKKEAYSMHTIPDDEVDKISDILYEAGKDWRIAFASALGSMTGIKSFPNKIFLSGGGSNIEVVEELLYEDGWNESIPFGEKLEIHRVDSKLWESVIEDELKLLTGSMLFVPASLCAIKLELDGE